MTTFRMMRKAFLICLLLSFAIVFTFESFQQRPQWVAPSSADNVRNPAAADAEATAEGKITYEKYCVPCHGDKGKGDGVAGMALAVPPGNLISKKVQQQTDGAIYWKITEGNPPMASYKTTLTDDQRWELVNYIRALGQPKTK